MDVINQEEYITVAEFADRAGVSRQAVYKQLNNKLKPYLQEVDNVKKLNTKAIVEIYGREDCKPKSQPVEQQLNNQLNNQLIELLNKQLEEKDKQIEELHRLLATSQMQLTESQHRVQMLEEQNTEQAETKRIQELETIIDTLEQEKKKKWWQKFFA